MKFNVGKRILLFFHWLLSLLVCALSAAYIIRRDFVMELYDKAVALVGTANLQIIGIAVLALYVILSLATIMLILRRGKKADRGFITVDSSETGKVRIAISAIEQMVRQSVNNIDGITDMKIAIENKEDAIAIGVVSTIVNGSHVPTITMNMQHAIRQFVEMNCGVAVRAVSITINSVAAQAETGRKRKRQRGELAAPAVAPVQPESSAYAQPAAPTPEPVSYVKPEETYAPAAEPEYVSPFSSQPTVDDVANGEEAPIAAEGTGEDGYAGFTSEE